MGLTELSSSSSSRNETLGEGLLWFRGQTHLCSNNYRHCAAAHTIKPSNCDEQFSLVTGGSGTDVSSLRSA
ncbi:hypothetical protein POX_f07714 [Penicillium oxalicum]|uniref:hypothetical protein n=1 Tax=Penicillium oxalicum TaxID=69781 RepID=UPI0020B719D4|nr:hypothetical protein POX_f07714 [Penicillium oxalicum]KAI2787351.1 hypothetical protein POX_f07714 [Penicillium oxalicum]